MSKPTPILYLSYNGLLSHLGCSQVLPYLKRLTEKGYQFFVISMEDTLQTYERLDTSFFNWYPLRRDRKKWRFLSSLKMVLVGGSLAVYLTLRHKIRIVHARSYLPGTISLILKLFIPTVKVVFDMRGFMLDEYLEGRILDSKSLWVGAGRFFERQIFRKADHIVTLTRQSVPILRQPQWTGDKFLAITVIPCSVSIPSLENDVARRREPSPGVRCIYSGSLGSWYDLPRMLSFFRRFSDRFAGSTLNILSPQSTSIEGLLQKSGLKERVRTATVGFFQVRDHLVQSDVGFIFYRRGFSRIGTSPIKFPEYLLAGLVTVATPGIGDLDELITQHRVGVLLDSDDDKVIDRVIDLLADPQFKTRCHWVAEKFYNLEDAAMRYERVYESLRS